LYLHVSSKEGIGSCFEFSVPYTSIIDRDTAPAPIENGNFSIDEITAKNPKHILVAEDNV